MHWSDLFNSGASLFIVATASTKTMVPLRILAIVTSCILIAFYAVTHAWVPMALQAIALPLNAYRLYQMIVLIRNVREASAASRRWTGSSRSWPSVTSGRATSCSPRAKLRTRCSAR
jgi:hypothetical protein